MNILNIIKGTVLGSILAVSSFFGIHKEAPVTNQVVKAPQTQVLGAYNPSGGGTYRLQTSIGSTNTTIYLSSFKEPISLTPYTMSYLNTSVGYGTLEPQQPTRSEFISFTGITQNSDGTALLTGVTRGLARSYPFTASSTFRTSHAGQSIFILSDSPQHFSEYATKQNNETISGTWTFASTSLPRTDGSVTPTGNQFVPVNYANTNYVSLSTSTSQTIVGAKIFSTEPTVPTPTASTSAVTKGYADALAIAGAPNAGTTTKGIVQEATFAQVQAGTATGTTGARLYINPTSIAGLGGTIATSTSFASSSMSSGTTTLFTITSTSTTQTINVWVKGWTGAVYQILNLYYSTSTQNVLLDTIQIRSDSFNFDAWTMIGSYTPTATGTVQLYNSSAAMNDVKAILQIIR